MFGAYVLIELSITVDFSDTLKAIRGVRGVKQAHLVTGPIDCIAYVEVADQQSALEALQGIRSVDGVTKTDTRMVANV